jgi:hypothetical protein
MAITLNKIKTEEIIHDDDSILTSLYGKIKTTDKVDCNKYTYFDTVDGYDLFVSETADDTLAVKAESEETTDNDKIFKDIEYIKSNYDIDLVKYDDIMSTVIIKVLENNTAVLDEIEKKFNEDKYYEIKRITPQVLFLEIVDVDIQLEDNSPLDKLSDQDMKNVITKAGVKLTGSENKERLKGIMQGVLSTAK